MLKLKLDITDEGKDYRDVSDEDMFRAVLARNNLYKENLLFRGMSGTRKIENLVKYGTDNPTRDTIMALNFNEVFIDPINPSLFDYCDIGADGRKAIAVYDLNQFTDLFRLNRGRNNEYVYRFKEPKNKKKSLIAIVSVEMD